MAEVSRILAQAPGSSEKQGGRREEGREQGRLGLGQGELSSAVVEKDGNQGRNWMEPVAPLLLLLTNNVTSTNTRQAHCDLVQNETT